MTQSPRYLKEVSQQLLAFLLDGFEVVGNFLKTI